MEQRKEQMIEKNTSSVETLRQNDPEYVRLVTHISNLDLSQGLPAEIEARQQQYEYYRDQLLTFKRM